MKCPGDADLQAFAVGNLSGVEFDGVAAHVEKCETCEAALHRFDRQADDLVDSLRRLPDAADGDEVPAELVQAARRSGSGIRTLPCRIGKFELVEELGAGSFGHVFRARDTELDRTVALKIPRTRGSPEETERFLREARSTAQLEHPSIVSLYETGETGDGVLFLVTEFVEGTTLERRLEQGALAPRDAARLMAEVADALHYAHSHGVIHRDVKPSNIMLDGEGRPHIMDLGLAKRETGEETVTVDGAVMGTPAYMSPELARGQSHEVDARSDVFSAGVVLYELVTGERPFQGGGRMLLLSVLEDEPRSPRRLNEKIPRDLETITLKALAKSPARRYATAKELANDLHRFWRGDAIRARPVGALERLWRWCRKNPLAASLFVAVSLGSALGFVHLSGLSRDLVRSSAYDSATQYASMLEEVNDFYSSEVVARANHHGVEATADYAAREGGIPLPATLLTALLQRISERGSGMRGSHFSDHPFRTRKDGGPKDAFQREALKHLQRKPGEPFFRFVEDYEGGPALRYATARVMKKSCVECHNTHPDSTKDDWRVGDVRGVLEVVRPLKSDRARIRAGLRGTFVMVGVVSAGLVVLTIGVLVLARRRRGR